MKFYWHPGEAVIAAAAATVGAGMVYLANPGFHPLAYTVGWFVIAAFVYQTGCEFYERRLRREQRRADAQNR